MKTYTIMCEVKSAFEVEVEAESAKEAEKKVKMGYYGNEEDLKNQLRANMLLDNLPQERESYLSG